MDSFITDLHLVFVLHDVVFKFVAVLAVHEHLDRFFVFSAGVEYARA